MCKTVQNVLSFFDFSKYLLDFYILGKSVNFYVIMQNEVIKVKKVNNMIGKILFNTALKAADVTVNSVCNFKFYQEKLDTQTEALRKYHDKKNS